jgi:4-amino-4-deoxychorismate lyase
MTTTRVLVDGSPGLSVRADDRGLLYGDGLFETCALRDGRPLLWARHLDRLALGCQRLGLPAPDREVLTRESLGLCAAVRRGVLKLLLTRGRGGRGYRPPAVPTPTRIVSLHPLPDYPPSFWTDGIELRVCATPLGDNPRLAGVKHLNRLEQVLARGEWDDPAVPEGLMLDTRGRVVEGTMSNVFAVTRGGLLTPALERCGVAGVMREEVLALAADLAIPARIGEVSLADLAAADEVLVTNSLIGLWPVRRVAGRSLAPGPMARRLLEALRRRGAV